MTNLAKMLSSHQKQASKRQQQQSAAKLQKHANNYVSSLLSLTQNQNAWIKIDKNSRKFAPESNKKSKHVD